MTTPSDLDLQLALAAELPEKITFVSGKLWWTWKIGETAGCESEIRDTEWDAIVRIVEQKYLPLHLEVYMNFSRNLANIVSGSESALMDAIHATWQQRAAALFVTLGRKVG